MRVTTKQWIPLACLCFWLGACSSSGGASPNQAGTGGSTDGGQPSATTGDDAGAGTGASVETTDGTTAGMAAEADTVGTTGGSTDIVGAAAIAELQGEWSTGCIELAGFFRTQTLSVIGPRMLYNFAAFSDQQCTTPVSLGAVVEGSTVQQSATTVPTGASRTTTLGDAREVNFYFEEATIDNQPIPAENFFGRDEFVERIDYDIVLVQDNTLYFGDTELAGYEGTSAASRPISLNLMSIYKSVSQ